MQNTQAQTRIKRERVKKGYTYRCPVCGNEVDGGEHPSTARLILNYGRKLSNRSAVRAKYDAMSDR